MTKPTLITCYILLTLIFYREITFLVVPFLWMNELSVRTAHGTRRLGNNAKLVLSIVFVAISAAAFLAAVARHA